MISTRDIIYWLKGSFPVSQVNENEVKFPCPICHKPNFYFNVKKKVGWCHHAKCKRRIFYSDLTQLLGTTPELSGYVPELDNSSLRGKALPCSIPNGSYPVIGTDLRDQWLVDVLITRGLTEKDIVRFALMGTAQWVYVPVYEQGKLVQYVGRRLNRALDPEKGFATEDLGRRYDYYKGDHITDYFFGWDQCKHWSKIVLVENTFNCIWLRDALQCTTNFGSYVSNTQIDKIAQSKVQEVVLLWDEGAEVSAQKAKIKLENSGIQARYIKIIGQPDLYSKEELKQLIG